MTHYEYINIKIFRKWVLDVSESLSYDHIPKIPKILGNWI